MKKFIQVRVEKDFEDLTEKKAESRGFNKSEYIRWLIEQDNSTDMAVVRKKVIDALEALSDALPAYLHVKYSVLKAQEQKKIFGELDTKSAKERDILNGVIKRLKELPDDDALHKAELHRLKGVFADDPNVLQCIDKIITGTDRQKTLDIGVEFDE